MKTLLVPMVMLSLVVLASDLWAVTPPAKIAYVEGTVWIKKKGDDTLSESMKGSGMTERGWGPTAPKCIANQRDSSRYDFEVPGKDVTEPMQGTWKERK